MARQRKLYTESIGLAFDDMPAIIAAAEPRRLRVTPKELRDMLGDALSAYDVLTALLPSNQSEVQAQREKILQSVAELRALLNERVSQDLFDLLHSFPAATGVPSVECGSLKVSELTDCLAATEEAIRLRVFSDWIDCADPEVEAGAGCPPFVSLVGELNDVFSSAFVLDEAKRAPGAGSIASRAQC